MLPVEYLFLLTHGPYEESFGRMVWGLNHHDYSRWAIFPALLILPGLRAFHLWQQDKYGKTGQRGFRQAFSGFVLAVIGQILSYMLFDPWDHPLHAVGFFLQLLAILLLFIGVPTWAIGIIRAQTLTGWQIGIPILWLLYILGLFVHIFTSDEMWLYPRYGIDTDFIASALLSISLILIGITLWLGENS